MAQKGVARTGVELWRHSDPQSTNMWRFMQSVNAKHNLSLNNYHELHKWSVDNIADFWQDVWHFTGVKASKPFDSVLKDPTSRQMFPRPEFFAGARLNFAENLLFPQANPDPASPALIAATEAQRESVTWAELRKRVQACQKGLKALGIKTGDRVAGYLGNHAMAVVAMLAATSLGALWTAVSPDSGVQMVVDRLSQIEPVLLFTEDGQWYNGKRFGVLDKVAKIMESAVGQSVKHVVVWDVVGEDKAKRAGISGEGRQCLEYEELVQLGIKHHAGASENAEDDKLEFEQLPADTPVYILYSSGTTGAPKCIVHGAIGTLIQHKKEHQIHSSVNAGEKLFYFTTVTWMMWHWLVSGLASGATLVLYDGSPMRYRSSSSSNSSSASPSTNTTTTVAAGGLSEPDDLAMPRLIDELGIEHFGTSAKYLSLLEQKNVMPRAAGVRMAALKAIYNTASPLAPSTFHYVYRAFGPDILLASITGGTDIVSLFGAPSPLNPVVAGEVQVAGLGMAVRTFASPSPDDNDNEGSAGDGGAQSGRDITDSGLPGDLVCVRPFPCQPVAFWGSEGVRKYRSSYFTTFGDTVWHHGDFVYVQPATRGLVMLGRSDGVLNPAGIRFGSAEVYNVLLKRFPDDIADGLCVGRRRVGDDDEMVLLFVKMNAGRHFSDELRTRIKRAIREDLSARHVPPVVEETPDIPVTVNGKKVEGEVKKIVSNQASSSRKGAAGKGSASVANPECLQWFVDWAARN